MGFNTFPCNPYPISTEELNKGNNDDLNTRVEALESDVSDLNSNKANQITIAPFFSEETAYTAGDMVYYNGLSYRCTNDHEGAWDADDFAATTISNELDSLKSGLTNVTSETVGEITYAETGYISPSFIKKINGIKMFYLFIAGSAVVIPTGSWVTVCTLPTGFRSQNDINTVLVNPDLHPFMVAINSNGNVDIYNYTADTKIDGSYILTFI